MSPPTGFIEFVEDKALALDQLQAVMQPAIAQNHHTNFGPVSETLEQALMALNGGSGTHVACTAANATLGLQALVATFDNHTGRRLRWVVSGFGFFTSFTGPFHDQIFTPCGADGQIDMQALRQIPVEDYDALLVTNVFGLHEDFAQVFAFARSHDKALLIDNAAGFRALAPVHAASDNTLLWAEVVSFHHTKPWGMGEGGAVFLPKDLAPTFRAATNFGIGGGKQLADGRYCSNGKMSEIAAAQILLRVKAHDDWTPAYRHEANRLLELGRAAGLTPLITDLPDRAVPGQLPFRAPHPVPLAQLDNPQFRILKYYRPGPQSGALARDIFDHVVNLPCHPGMAQLSDEIVLSVLKSVLNGP